MSEHIICAILWIVFCACFNFLVKQGINGDHVTWYVAGCTIMFVCCCIISWQAMLIIHGLYIIICLVRGGMYYKAFAKQWHKKK